MKALVEATPISGPAWIGKTKSESLAIELSTTLTTEQVFTLFFLHKSRAAKVSAVSPDWDTKIYKCFLFKLTFDDLGIFVFPPRLSYKNNPSLILNLDLNFLVWGIIKGRDLVIVGAILVIINGFLIQNGLAENGGGIFINDNSFVCYVKDITSSFSGYDIIKPNLSISKSQIYNERMKVVNWFKEHITNYPTSAVSHFGLIDLLK